MLAMVAGGILLVATKESPYPSEWDPRVAELAQWTEGARDLKFEHPVDVLFLTPEEYSGESTGDVTSDSDLEAEDQEAMKEAVGMLRALGLVEGEVDLTEANNTLTDSGTLAFYSPQTKTVYVRGTELTPALRVTLVHELVHVLQDQHFDLTRLADLESGAATSLRAVAEGDATRVENTYVEKKLNDEEEADYIKESQETYDETAGDIDAKVPPAMSALFASPYIFGPRLVEYLFVTGGTSAIDAALEDPPSEFALFDPINNAPKDNPASDQVQIPVTPVHDGDLVDVLDDGTFGPEGWYLMMAARLDPRVALTATDGIKSDGYAYYRQDDTVCVSATAQADGKDMDELTSALEEWAAKSPDGSADLELTDSTITLRSCDPGEEMTGVGDVSVELLLFAAIRTEVYVALISDDTDPQLASCYSQGLVEKFTVDELTDPEFGNVPVEAQRFDQLAMSCS
ncbi:MAG: hypothetical protein ABI239_07215 [Aquihabitans sp.]